MPRRNGFTRASDSGKLTGMTDAGAAPVVLVVDDDGDHAFMLEAVLEAEGYTVLVAASRAEARAVLETCAVDVLLTDLSLGDGTALDLLVELPARPRVAIVLSGFDGLDDVDRTIDAGFDAHLTKPASLAALREAIASGLRRSSGIRLHGERDGGARKPATG
jgi:DNA-binding response OmpR family regulator